MILKAIRTKVKSPVINYYGSNYPGWVKLIDYILFTLESIGGLTAFAYYLSGGIADRDDPPITIQEIRLYGI